MAFDQPTRNRLARFVSDARAILSAEFTRQLQHEYGLDPVRGDVTPIDRLTALDDARRETARVLRETMAYYLAGQGGADAKVRREVLDRIVREQAFTVLNRLCAFRMAEARGLILESIGKGYESRGFQLYARLAGSALGERGDVYRTYLFSMMDEFAVDLPVLFDRFSPQGRLFPREAALLKLLELVNNPEIDPLWAEDETIGWIYQYFNSKEERKAMRDASQAPRTSRELAVRNQFFTPRYVVEFLTDNTLGRIWYEMTRGETALKDICRYLVRRPNEIFLNESEEAPAQEKVEEDLSQDELLKQPVYIPHRPIKDPRELKMLDPACGSMHFGLYAFDLFEQIYAEAWDLEETLGAGALCRLADLEPLHQTYPDRKAYLRDVPRLIIERNIHGVDIDPRAVQIAGLSLWLRAQRSWQVQGLKPAERPQIRRSNVVCAEPMPGDRSLLDEFLATLREEKLEALMRRTWHVPAGQRVRATRQMADGLAKLVRTVWQEMELAGEAGSLLKVEETLRDAIAAARKESEEKSPLFRVLEYGLNEPVNEQYVQLVAGEDQDFFDRAEGLVLAALREYAEQAENGGGYRRRLFVEDATQGFAFIDLCRIQYEVVLMNPPFGEPSNSLLGYLETCYRNINKNLLCAFLIKGFDMLISGGCIGAIYDRTAVIKTTYEPFRRNFLVADSKLVVQAELGWEVLDANVEVTTSILEKDRILNQAAFFDVEKENPKSKGEYLYRSISELRSGGTETYHKINNPRKFIHFPNAVLGHYFPDFAENLFTKFPNLEDRGVRVIAGHTILSDRFFRYWWEVPLTEAFLQSSRWQRLYNGGDYCRFNSPLCDAVLYGENGELIVDHASTILRNPHLQKKGKLGFGKRGDFIDAHVLPSGFVSSVEGQAVIINGEAQAFSTLALLNSHVFQAVINLYCGQHKYPGYVHLIPCPEWQQVNFQEAEKLASKVFAIKDMVESGDETNPRFIHKNSIAFWHDKYEAKLNSVCAEVDTIEREINNQIEKSYSLDEPAKRYISEISQREPTTGGWLSEDPKNFWGVSCISFVVGSALGRWDIRTTTDDEYLPEMEDPFAPLPVCPPCMLKNSQGLPADPEDILADYPLRISWSGILVDDEGHPEDVEKRAQEALRFIWQERTDVIEQETCQLLGVRSLREYFRKPGGFFADHLKRYSKNRRQAPIYWPLSTPSSSYTLWLYYHRLTDQTLFTCVNDFVDPKLKQVIDDAARLRLKKIRSTGDEKELERLADFEHELKDFRNELLRIAKFWKPNLNDGVEITASPLWKLFQHKPWQKRLKETWQKLEAGEYDWAHLAYSIRPEQVREKCKSDKSLAIAHGFEALYVEPEQPLKQKKGKMKKEAEADSPYDEV